jgi:hypothetical protein
MINPEEQEKLDGTKARIKEEFVDIKFQLGPIRECGANGTTMEHIMELLIARLKGFQEGPYACSYNRLAILSLLSAHAALSERTAERTRRGVEGLNKV